MATIGNTDARFGFKPIRMLDSSPWNGAVIRCHMPATYATATFIGDAVVPTGTATGSNNQLAVMEVNEAGTNDAVLGAVVAYEPDASDPSLQYRKASTARYCLVSPGLNVMYIAQAEGTIAVTDIGDCVDIIVTHDGSTVTGLSGHEADQTGAGAAAQLQLMALHDHGDQPSFSDTFPIVEVRINEQELGDNSAGT